MKGGGRKRSKDTWYVSFQSLEHVGERSRILRTTETFPNERDAKAFAKVRLADGSSINAGTLNPHLPKRTITVIRPAILMLRKTPWCASIELAASGGRIVKARSSTSFFSEKLSLL
jgi:hypothetical protein